MARSRLSIFSNASEADVRVEPYPHLVIKDALDAEIFEELERQFPTPEVILNGREAKETWFDYPACLANDNDAVSPLWQEFNRYHTSQDFWLDIVDLFGPAIHEVHPGLERLLECSLSEASTAMRLPGANSNPANHKAMLSMECQFYLNRTQHGRTIRGPHVDRPSEIYAALLYFRRADDQSEGSDLNVCEAIRPKELYPTANQINIDHLPMEVNQDKVKIHSTARYEPNTLVFFLNTPKSLHAVSPRSPTDVPRRHMNITGDLFNLPKPGLFEVLYRPKHRFKLWLERQPVIWRGAHLVDD